MTNTSGCVVAALMLAAVAVALPSEHARAQTLDPTARTIRSPAGPVWTGIPT